MIHVSVLGATGKVGLAVVDEIERTDDLALAEPISASGDADSTPLSGAAFEGEDVVVDFSSPAGTMTLLDRLAGNAVPVVVGTTGFSPEQVQRLQDEGRARPILVGANFTKGFEAFARAARTLAGALPDADLTVGEIYNARKKSAASGTTQRLYAELGESGRPVATEIQRIGDTPGVNTITLDYGVATITLELGVRSRAAYAAGALDAARWLIHQPRGFYQPADLLTD